MPRGTSSKARRVDYVADFETTTTEDDCRVWGWGIARVDTPDTVHLGHTIDDFISYVSQRNSVIYFHNLKFDVQFIMYYLLTHGYKGNSDNRSLAPMQYNELVSDMGRWYSLKVIWPNGNSVEFRDSWNKIPMKLSRVAEAFKMEESKGEIDYHSYRPVGHVMTDEERDYLRRDVSIIAKAIQMTLEEGMTRLTVASDALAEFKHLFGNRRFTDIFPVLPLPMDSEIRKAYRGGFTYADPRFKQKRTRSGITLDVNSLYPYIMHSSLLPYGEPVYHPGYVELTKQRPLSIFTVTFTAKIKKNHIPCIQIKNASIFSGTEYLSAIDEPTTLSVTNVDWDLWNKHYDIDVLSWDGGWSFTASEGFFNEYIDKWSKVKAESTGGRRELAKLTLNSLYGRFALNPSVTGKYAELKNNRVVYRRGTEDTRPPVYTAMGVFITAYARALTISAAQDNYDCFAYADTDSLHLLTDDLPEGLEVHPSKLGAWKLEYAFSEAFYVRAKAYMEKLSDADYEKARAKNEYAKRYVNRVAGLPEGISENLTFDDVWHGAEYEGKLKPVNVPGGVVLKPTPYRMSFD